MSEEFGQPEDLAKYLSKEYLKSLKIYLNNTKTHVRKDGVRKREEYFSDINKAYRQEDLVLVLGSGISVPYKIPNWSNLLQRLLLETFNAEESNLEEPIVLSKLFPALFPNSPLISARFLERDFKENNKIKSFEEAIKEALYERVDRSANSSTIKEILHLCIAPGRSPNLDSIITYNYDDVLEDALIKSEIEIPFKSIYKEGVNPENRELPIYHVHGYLPQEQEIDQKHMITLSESLYHKQYSDIYSWSNMVQINKFKDKTCIFIGLSLTDPNIRRLLDISIMQKGENPKHHYLIKKKYSLTEVTQDLRKVLGNDPELLKQKSQASLEIIDTAKVLIKRMEDFEEIDASSFGIKIIWIDDYDEIAEVLKEIRNK